MHSVLTVEGTRFAYIEKTTPLIPYMEMIKICCENYVENENKFYCYKERSYCQILASADIYRQVLKSQMFLFFISVFNELDAQNFCFTISLFHASTCFEQMCSSSGVRIALHSLWYHHTYRWPSHAQVEREVLSQPVHQTATYRCDDTRGCVMQF